MELRVARKAQGEFPHLRAAVTAAAHEAATSQRNDLAAPTEAQIEAGNYKKGHVRINGLDISIENPAGSKRRPEWPALQNHYGYIKGTIGKDIWDSKTRKQDDGVTPAKDSRVTLLVSGLLLGREPSGQGQQGSESSPGASSGGGLDDMDEDIPL